MKINNVVISGKVHKVESRELNSGNVSEIRFRQTFPRVDSPEPGNPEHWRSEWFSAECWDKTAEYAQTVRSGDTVCVEGRLSHREWNDKTSGDRREKYVVKAHRVHIVKHGEQAETPAAPPSRESVPF